MERRSARCARLEISIHPGFEVTTSGKPEESNRNDGQQLNQGRSASRRYILSCRANVLLSQDQELNGERNHDLREVVPMIHQWNRNSTVRNGVCFVNRLANDGRRQETVLDCWRRLVRGSLIEFDPPNQQGPFDKSVLFDPLADMVIVYVWSLDNRKCPADPAGQY